MGVSSEVIHVVVYQERRSYEERNVGRGNWFLAKHHYWHLPLLRAGAKIRLTDNNQQFCNIWAGIKESKYGVCNNVQINLIFSKIRLVVYTGL